MPSQRLQPPFDVEHELNLEMNGEKAVSHLPGYPHIPLEDSHRIWSFLHSEFCSDDVDHLADKLWWMSKQDSASISPIHRQRVKQRAIVVTEDPKLHLVWIRDRVFIKPLPCYILSHAFWQLFLSCNILENESHHHIRRAALGYIRTYQYLVRYESDFRIAQEADLQLIPSDVTWDQFCHFRDDLASISDGDVSTRYCYGEIRLTRLNFYAPLLLRKSYFQRVDYQYEAYFARFYGPILFGLGIVSVILSGLQVAVAVEQRAALAAFALVFSVAIIAVVGALLFWLASLLIYKVAKEWIFALQDRRRLLVVEKRKADQSSPFD
ncbi:hypothetical protein AAL_08371 [Moelleriella libera RCEF 2490]|uniref:Subtilisin-like serine protease n=1 Tax=Moelleriella libera RCEF 2490 TaxID=1081109 RepID=A0A166N3A8_9HYPO|nr:hypothetical protein AAL_08371 [Moelleriella libera RCEF 2490]